MTSNDAISQLDDLISLGERALREDYHSNTTPGVYIPDYISGDTNNTWLSKSKIFCERHLSDHPLHDEIIELINKQNGKPGKARKLLVDLKTVKDDDEYWKFFAAEAGAIIVNDDSGPAEAGVRIADDGSGSASPYNYEKKNPETQVSQVLALSGESIRNNERSEDNERIGSKNNTKAMDKVFVVYGHDAERRKETELFLRRIGLDPIILMDKVDQGMTIIEKIEHYADDVKYGIVLYTACDVGRGNDDIDLKKRARQNVVFEHGYLVGKMGRSKVAAIVDEGIEVPGDLAGVVYISVKEDWRNRLKKELHAAGVEFNPYGD